MDNDDLKPLLLTLIGKIDGLIGDVAGLTADVAQLKADVGQLKADMAVVRPAVARLETAQAVTSARLDEQRSVLAALIPTRIAAVPPAAE
jgi:hypothetical protein